MGSIIGGVIGGIGSLIGGNAQAKAQKQAADKAAEASKYAADKAASTARLGFDYLTESPLAKEYLPTGAAANSGQAALLGVGGNPEAQGNAFQRYLDSTGFKFQMDQGQKAITTSNAAKGLLSSGSTLKRLTQYGQDLASTKFGNYFSQLGELSQRGLAAGSAIGSAGSYAGGTGANAIAGAGNTAANAISQGYGNAASSTGAGIQGFASGLGNVFGTLLKR